MLSDTSQIDILVGLVGLWSHWIRLELPDPVGFDLKIWPYHCHSDSKKIRSESTQIRPNPSGSTQIQWVTGKTSDVGQQLRPSLWKESHPWMNDDAFSMSRAAWPHQMTSSASLPDIADYSIYTLRHERFLYASSPQSYSYLVAIYFIFPPAIPSFFAQ